jgi:hypothetical protein
MVRYSRFLKEGLSADCRCARGQVFSAGLTEFGEEIHSVLVGEVHHLMKRAVGPK